MTFTRTPSKPAFEQALDRIQARGARVSNMMMDSAVRRTQEAEHIGWPGLQRSWERSLARARQINGVTAK